jgi:hypothetical protein
VSEPIDPVTLRRLEATQAMARRIRMVDMPAGGSPVVVAQPPRSTLPARDQEAEWRSPVRQHRRPTVTGRPDLTREYHVIVAMLAARYGCEIDDIKAHRRSVAATEARGMGYAILKEVTVSDARPTGASLVHISLTFGRDHASVQQGIRVHNYRLADDEYATRYKAILRAVRAALEGTA